MPSTRTGRLYARAREEAGVEGYCLGHQLPLRVPARGHKVQSRQLQSSGPSPQKIAHLSVDRSSRPSRKVGPHCGLVMVFVTVGSRFYKYLKCVWRLVQASNRTGTSGSKKMALPGGSKQ